jgi:type VI secretion system secreted protein Hcp
MSGRQALLGAGLCALFAVMGTTPAFAPIYMHYEGIDGDVAAADHQNWIEVQSYSWGATQPSATMVMGTGAPPTGNGPGVLTIRKRVDKATPLLARAVQGRTRTPTVTIDLPAPRGQQGYMTYKMTDVIISSYGPGAGAGGAMPMESISMNYSKIEWSYKPQAAPAGRGALGAPQTVAPRPDPGY